MEAPREGARAAPLLPTKCYFSASISAKEMDEVGVAVFDSKDECGCIPHPPPPAAPPSEIYFCGLPAVQRFFDSPLDPTQCYYSFALTRIEVMSQGVNVSRRAARRRRSPAPPRARARRSRRRRSHRAPPAAPTPHRPDPSPPSAGLPRH